MVSPHANPSNKPSKPRACGGCNVCCTAMRVASLNKPAGVDCAHQTDQGCGIYDRRPTPCRTWYCMWIRDDGRVFADHHRPDRLGVFFTASEADPHTGEQTIFAHEVHPHAAATPEPAHVIRSLRRYAPVKTVPTRTHLTHNGHPLR